VISLVAIIGRGEAKRYGGAGKLLLSALLEFLHSVLLAPVRMLFHTQFVLAALAGVNLAWKSPPRHDDANGWGEAVRRHALGSVLALTWIGVIIVSATAFQWWLSPVLAGLLLAIPLSAWTSRSGPGRWLAERRIFVIPEELAQPPVLAEADRYASAFAATPGFADAVSDAATHAEVVNAIPMRPPARGAKAEAQARLIERAATEGPDALTPADQLRLLADAQALGALRALVLAGRANAGWAVRAANVESSPAIAERDAQPVDSIVSAH
jgi:membrane glycosyltransferase